MSRKVDIFLRLTLLIVCIVADATLNSSRVMTLGFDTLTTYAWLGVAVACAMAPAIISSYGDDRAVSIGLFSCLASFILSVWAVYSSIDQRAFDSHAVSSSAPLYAEQLVKHDESAAHQRSLCSTKPVHECNSLKLEEKLKAERKEIQNQLISAQTTKPMTPFEMKITMGILMGIALFLQIWGAELGRQIGQTLKNSGSRTRTDAVPEPAQELGSEPETSSLTRNQNQESSEPKPKNTELKKLELKKSRTHSNIPNDIEKQSLKSAYGAMKNMGEKVIGETLGKKAGLSKGKALWWLKHDKPQVIGL